MEDEDPELQEALRQSLAEGGTAAEGDSNTAADPELQEAVRQSLANAGKTVAGYPNTEATDDNMGVPDKDRTVTVRTISGEAHEIPLAGCMTLLDLRSRVAKKVGLNVCKIKLSVGDDALNDDTSLLDSCGVIGGATVSLAVMGESLVSVILNSGSALTSRVMSSPVFAEPRNTQKDLTCQDLYIDEAGGNVYFADYDGKQVGCTSMATPGTVKILSGHAQSVTAVVVSAGRLLFTTAGNPSGELKNGELVALDLASGESTVLLKDLHCPSAIAAAPDGGIYITEGAGGTIFGGNQSLCKVIGDGPYQKEVLRRLKSSPTSLVALPSPGLFAIGFEGPQTPGKEGEVYVVSTDATQEPRLAINGLAANQSLALDGSGCLYCAGRGHAGVSGTVAFPDFAESAAAGSDISQRVTLAGMDDYSADAVAVSADGRTMFFSTGKKGSFLKKVAVE